MGMKNNKENGFTLLEMVIALIVIGLIATPFIQEYRLYAVNEAKSTTQERFYTIETAIQDYYEQNGYLPCPAESFTSKSTDGMGNVLYGDAASTLNIYEAADDFGLQNCDDFEDELDSVEQTVLIGSVPTRSLGLNARQALDGWNNKITYVVSKYMLNIPAYDAEQVPLNPSPLADRLSTKIAFFGRDTSGIPTCNNVALGGFEEKYIAREMLKYIDDAFNAGANNIPANTSAPSTIIQSDNQARDVVIINEDPETMIEELCLDYDTDPGSDIVFGQVTDPGDLTMMDNVAENSNHVLLISHGPTGNGAFNGYGAMASACDETALDGRNCIRRNLDPDNNLFYTNQDKLTAGGTGADFYDDITYSVRADTFKLFTDSRPDTPGSNESYTPYQILGINTDDPMGGPNRLETAGGEKLPGIDVGGDIRVEAAGGGAGRALASTICNEAGPDAGVCFSPSIIAGSGMGCDFTNSAITGISNNDAECFRFAPLVAGESCGTNEVMVGVLPNGRIICEAPPPPL